MNYFKPSNYIIMLIAFVCLTLNMKGQTIELPTIDSSVYKIVRVKPSETNKAITYWDTAHAVYYNPALKNNKLLIWLAGTNGTPDNIPVSLFTTALEQGYKIIALSYITVPAVAQICKDSVLDVNSNCAADFRQMRIYGDNNFTLIPDMPHDAIIPRLIKQLQYLQKNDGSGNWSYYLEKGTNKLNWKNIAVWGQSQGGGMAQYIGMKEHVARVISFSGGWDFSKTAIKKIATWYADKKVTPLQNWYATYHINELAAKSLKEICEALGMPTKNVFALDKPLNNEKKISSNPYHGEGIRNAEYKPIWITMLGSGK